MLKEKINSDLKSAMKERDEVSVSTLRMISAALKNKEIEKRAELSDEEVLKVLSSEKKKHQDSIAQFEVGGRADLVSRERAEMAVVEKYLSAAMPEEELRALVVAAVAESGAASAKDFGAVMKLVVARAAGRADGAVISAIVKESLNK